MGRRHLCARGGGMQGSRPHYIYARKLTLYVLGVALVEARAPLLHPLVSSAVHIVGGASHGREPACEDGALDALGEEREVG